MTLPINILPLYIKGRDFMSKFRVQLGYNTLTLGKKYTPTVDT